jgi:hypothetical protein
VETTFSGAIVSGGTIDDSGLFLDKGSIEINLQGGLGLSLGVDSSGNSDELFLTVESSVNAKATGMLGWIETV